MTEADLASAVKDAANSHTPLHIRGGASRAGLGHPVTGTPLELGGLQGITLYEPGALTIVAKAGTPMAEIQAALAAENQQLPFEPMDHRSLYGTNTEPTIGGVVATNASGSRRIQAGACRDSLLGVRFVDGRGDIISNGGRVMKNVTGYDLVKLLCGSHGTLGALTEVSLKVLPRAELSATLTISGTTPQAACAAMVAALGAPFDVTGAAHLVDSQRTLIRVEGFEGSVRYRASQLTDLLGRFGDISVEDNATVWDQVRDAVPVLGEGDIWRISVKPTEGPAVLEALDPLSAIMDWGGGLVWVRVPAGRDVRQSLSAIAGHATLIRAADETKTRLGVFAPEVPSLARISAGLRAKFDPNGVLNPGRMAPRSAEVPA